MIFISLYEHNSLLPQLFNPCFYLGSAISFNLAILPLLTSLVIPAYFIAETQFG